MYYEMVPFAVMKAILCRLVQELAWDSSAIDVRVAVLQVSINTLNKGRYGTSLYREALLVSIVSNKDSEHVEI